MKETVGKMANALSDFDGLTVPHYAQT